MKTAVSHAPSGGASSAAPLSASVSHSTLASMHPSLALHSNQLQLTCQSCKKILTLDTDKPIADTTIDDFRKTFSPINQNNPLAPAPNAATTTTTAGSASSGSSRAPPAVSAVVDQLAESFIILPAAKIQAQQAANTRPNMAAGAGTAPPSANSANASSGAGGATTTTLDRQVQSLTRVLQLVQARVPVATPLCTHCSGSVMSEVDKRTHEFEKDREEYMKCLRELQKPLEAKEDAAKLAEEERLEAEEEAELIRQEQQLEQKLAAIRKEKLSLQLESQSLDHELNQVTEFESQFWREYEDYSLQIMQVNEEQTHMKNQIKNANEALERLKRTNVFDDAFHISHDGHFATINGFRLGRLPSQPVEWAETSAALGQVLLLLHTMARHTNYKFQKYRLMPMGSYSKMAKLDDLSTTYELYGSNDLILGRLFWYRRFDTALVWLLACIQEFADYAASIDPKVQLKYPIRNDMIGDVSIKLQFNNDAKWTKSLKYLLVNLRMLLGWVVKYDAQSSRSAAHA